MGASHILVYLEGDVTVRRGEETFSGEEGMTLLEGDTIETGKDSLALIELIQGRTLKVIDQTILVLENTRTDTNLSLEKGGLFVKVKGLLSDKFFVRTETVAAGIRGTEFYVAYGRTFEEGADVWLCVNEGSVNVEVIDQDKSLIVEEGEGINILSGRELTEPREYKWTENLNWNTDPTEGSLVNETDPDSLYADLLDVDYF
ncbi:MAG: FecR family protein [Spirochaetales bacterium]|nr:FecR family protein [Spirochaetales bacterium]